MKINTSNHKNRALTLVELLVVIVVLFILLALFDISGQGDSMVKARRINCLNNLKQVGLAYRIWAGDNNDAFPMDLSLTNGGTLELMETDEAWRTYQVMSNELSTPRILHCPADERRPDWATNFSDNLKGKISYFIGLEAGTNSPRAFLSGDDNLAVAGQPVKPGLLSLSSKAAVSWTAGRHHSDGNIGLSDGSVRFVKKAELPARISETGLATNRLFIP